ncbi:MAG: dTDP-4-dehydrorhamnose 3,5-epimerase [Sphingomonadales bacterium]|nr:dTDP-4-dehydrorhamnose 3,5-epimerase [Sphingomonadales bacterium]
MQFRRFDISGLLEIIPTRHSDERGYFAEIFREDRFTAEAGETRFVQENQSLSVRQGTIRGIHFQTDPFAQGKLVRCTSGAIFDVAVDLRHGSPTFARWIAVELTPERANQLWIPVGFGHAFCTLQENSTVCYKVTAGYSAPHDGGVAWDDPAFAIAWPALADASTLSAKDRVQPGLAELGVPFRMER